MPRLTYWQIFSQLNENTLQVLRKIKVGSVEFDKGATITKGTLVAGLDFFAYLSYGNVEIEGDEVDDTLVVRKIIYRNE